MNVGCIPSKALLESSHHYEFAQHGAAAHGISLGAVTLDLAAMQKRKDDVVAANTKGVEFLFKKNKITWARGTGTLRAGNVVEVTRADGAAVTYHATDVIIATGSVPIALPFLPFDEERVLSNIGALTLPEVPKHLVVIGGGVIGLELGSVWRRLGAKVTVVELLPAILPGIDADVVKEADRAFRKQGLDLRTGTKVTGAKRDKKKVLIDDREGRREGDARRRLRARRRRPEAVAHRHRRRRARPRRSARAARSSSTRRCAPTSRTSTPSATRSAACSSRTRPRRRASSPPR